MPLMLLIPGAGAPAVRSIRARVREGNRNNNNPRLALPDPVTTLAGEPYTLCRREDAGRPSRA